MQSVPPISEVPIAKPRHSSSGSDIARDTTHAKLQISCDLDRDRAEALGGVQAAETTRGDPTGQLACGRTAYGRGQRNEWLSDLSQSERRHEANQLFWSKIRLSRRPAARSRDIWQTKDVLVHEIFWVDVSNQSTVRAREGAVEAAILA